jgi:hypothetical protein
MLRRMSDDFAPEPDDIRALIEETDVDAREGDRDWNYQFWIPEYAEPILGEAIFQSLEGRLAAIPGVERLGWEDREVFLARVTPDTTAGELRRQVAEVVRGAVVEAGYELP